MSKPRWSGTFGAAALRLFALLFAVACTLAQAAPTVTLTGPADGSLYHASPAPTITITATASSPGQTVTKVEFYQGTTLLGTDTSSAYSFTWKSVPAGTYVLTAKVYDNASQTATSAPSTITVSSSNTPPTVTLTSPVAGATYLFPASVTVSATAAAPELNGTVSKVEFLVNDAVVITDTGSPYTGTWKPSSAGTYTIKARATDQLGATTTTSGVSITVTATNTAPSVSLTGPAAGSYVTPGTITLTATANPYEANDTITKVEFFANTTLLNSDTASPYSYTWSNPAAGTYTLTARATDSKGAQTTSSGVVVTVAANAAPTVTLTAPTAGNYVTPGTIALGATASAPELNDTVAKVEFLANGNVVGTVTSAPYNFNWTNPVAGTYAVAARATDGKNAITTTPTVNVTVAANTAPTVSLTSPSGGGVYALPASITLNATASAPELNDTVTQVEFLANGAVISTSTTPPYSFTWSNMAAASYALTARATDGKGAQTTSAAVNIIVEANVGPTVTLTSPANNAQYQPPASITLTATASDPETNDAVSQVEFYAGSTLIGTVTSAPYTYNWTNVATGNYTLTAKAYDTKGGVTTSAPRSIVVAPLVAAVYYVHPDHLNTPRLITDSVGTTVWRWANDDPFGGNAPDAGSFVCNLRLPGQYFDAETGLNYNYFRDYDPSIGRYIQSDPIGLKGGVNTYGYVGSNPIGSFDPTGTTICDVNAISEAIQQLLPHWKQPAMYQFSSALSGKGGVTTMWPSRKAITLPSRVLGCLSDDEVSNLTLSMTHELIHYNSSWYDFKWQAIIEWSGFDRNYTNDTAFAIVNSLDLGEMAKRIRRTKCRCECGR